MASGQSTRDPLLPRADTMAFRLALTAAVLWIVIAGAYPFHKFPTQAAPDITLIATEQPMCSTGYSLSDGSGAPEPARADEKECEEAIKAAEKSADLRYLADRNAALQFDAALLAVPTLSLLVMVAFWHVIHACILGAVIALRLAGSTYARWLKGSNKP